MLEKMLLNEPFSYRFPATRGLQHKPYFQINVPLSILVKMLNLDDKGSTLERSQRSVNENRAKGFGEYLIRNVKENSFYIFPSIIGVIDTPVNSKPATFFDVYEVLNVKRSNDVNMLSQGVLVVSMDSTIKLFDGQHRSSGSAYAIRKIATDPELKDLDLSNIHVPFMAYTDLTLVERQIGFSDTNNNLSKPPAAISIAYDHRDAMSQFAVELSTELMCFKDMVDFERNAITGANLNYFSLKTIRDATQSFLGLNKKQAKEGLTAEQKEIAKEFWMTFSRHTGWSALNFGLNDARDHRETHLNTYAVFLKALALAAKNILTNFISFDKVDLSKLDDLDVSRWSDDFKDRAFDQVSGKMKPDSTGVMLTANKLQLAVGCPLDIEQAQLEKQYFGEFVQPKVVQQPEPQAEEQEVEEVVFGQMGQDFTTEDATVIATIVGKKWSDTVTEEQIEDAAAKIYKVVGEFAEEDGQASIEFLKDIKQCLVPDSNDNIESDWRALNRINSLRSQLKKFHDECVAA
ncbi:DNA sulfur modification protein DndB [Vibrio sp. THAF190c]|uniref:DNA sulfur modification protein DndB n=1 Tax=Vibrio sp. THAF190c TaxID=2587865 RepID=UPI00126804D5|nr:DNA sulfur modification protein DndB [Vibrio sp. THAF190c]QFT13580.1 hypothetical protein FIV04_26855 [Vibrio sp. THAF190c]